MEGSDISETTSDLRYSITVIQRVIQGLFEGYFKGYSRVIV